MSAPSELAQTLHHGEGFRGGQVSAKELCRKHGISDGTYYKWRSKYGGMEVSEAKRLKALEAENAKLKSWRDQQRPPVGRLPRTTLAEHMLDVATLKEVLGKNF